MPDPMSDLTFALLGLYMAGARIEFPRKDPGQQTEAAKSEFERALTAYDATLQEMTDVARLCLTRGLLIYREPGMPDQGYVISPKGAEAWRTEHDRRGQLRNEKWYKRSALVIAMVALAIAGTHALIALASAIFT